LGLSAIFPNFCSFLGLYELVQVKKVYCRFTDDFRARESRSLLRLSFILAWAQAFHAFYRRKVEHRLISR
jgi:hypothetical protein